MDNKEFAKALDVAGKKCLIYDIHRLEQRGIGKVSRLPLCIRALVENVLRRLDGEIVREEHLLEVARGGQATRHWSRYPFFRPVYLLRISPECRP